MAGPSASGQSRLGPRTPKTTTTTIATTASTTTRQKASTTTACDHDNDCAATTTKTSICLPSATSRTTTYHYSAPVSSGPTNKDYYTVASFTETHSVTTHNFGDGGERRGGPRAGNGGFASIDDPSSAAAFGGVHIVGTGFAAGAKRLPLEAGSAAANGTNHPSERVNITGVTTITTLTTVAYNGLAVGHSGSDDGERGANGGHEGESDATIGGNPNQAMIEVCEYANDHITNCTNTTEIDRQQAHSNATGRDSHNIDNDYFDCAASNSSGGSIVTESVYGHGSIGVSQNDSAASAARQRPTVTQQLHQQQPFNHSRNRHLFDSSSAAATAAANATPAGVAVAPAAPVPTPATTSSTPSAPSTTKVVWRRREQQDATSTEGSLRAMLNKLAPSQNSLDSLATQVAGHLLEDEVPEELARQLVDRAQLEPIYAATYARLCSVLVRVRSGYVFYKHLMARCRSTYAQGVRALIAEPMETCDDSENNHVVTSTSTNRNHSGLFPNVQHQQRVQHQVHLYPSQMTSQRHYPVPIQQPLQHQQQQGQLLHRHHPYSLPQLQQNQRNVYFHHNKQQHHLQQLQSASVIHQVNHQSLSTMYQDTSLREAVSSSGSSSHNNSYRNRTMSNDESNSVCSNNYPTSGDLQRHRLKALVVFLCHLFIENQLTFDRLYDDYLKLLEVYLPGNDIALECVCSALSCAGQAMESAQPQWVLNIVHQLQAALRPLHDQRKLRMIFMVQDLVEMHQRNWQPRESSALTSAQRMPRDQAEPWFRGHTKLI